jgi:hypothetical protein
VDLPSIADGTALWRRESPGGNFFYEILDNMKPDYIM